MRTIRQIAEIDIVLPYFEALCSGFVPAISDMLTEKERKNLLQGAFWITLEQAMRFLTDYLNGDVYYKTTYPEQNLIRTRNQIAFFRAMEREQAALEEIINRFF